MDDQMAGVKIDVRCEVMSSHRPIFEFGREVGAFFSI